MTSQTISRIIEERRPELDSSWPKDIAAMHRRYQVHDRVDNMTPLGLQELLNFRIAFLDEEMEELKNARDVKNPEEIVDALIDLCVVAIGTLDIFGIDAQKAWLEVLKANMAKEVGVNPSRPNPLGLPDLVKPKGWEGPNHRGNWGRFDEL